MQEGKATQGLSYEAGVLRTITLYAVHECGRSEVSLSTAQVDGRPLRRGLAHQAALHARHHQRHPLGRAHPRRDHRHPHLQPPRAPPA